MNIDGIEDLSNKNITILFKYKITTIQGQSFNQRRHKDWKNLVSRQKALKKHKTNFNR